MSRAFARRTTLVGRVGPVLWLGLALGYAGCGTETPTTNGTGGTGPTGGATASGGTTSSGGTFGEGGSAFGGSNPSTGGAATGGRMTGGSATGGAPSGGKATGGTATGGTITGGAPSGGKATGGTGTGGTATGGKATGGTTGAGGTHSGAWKFMPLGDSITGTTCYPQLLSQQFKTNHHTNFQFVGTVTNNQSCSGAPNVVTEGHGGYFVTYLLTNSPPASGKGTLTELQTWAAEKPDIVLMHYGTNDVWSNIAPATILAAYVSVINEFRKQNASVIFLVSKIIAMNPSGCSACGSRVVSLDALITDAWASTNSTASSPIYIVDQWTGFDAAADTSDGVHPNLTGSQKMAAKAYAAVVSHGWF